MHRVERRIDRLMHQVAMEAGSAPFLLLPAGLEYDDGSCTSTLTVLSYADVYAASVRMARALKAAGVEPGDRIACVMGNSQELVCFMVACSLCGAIAVTLNTLSTASEIERILHDCEPSVVLFHARFLSTQNDQQLPESVKCRVVVGVLPSPGLPGHWMTMDRFLSDGDTLPLDVQRDLQVKVPPDPRFSDQDPAVMIYSSGTTGMPKGIVLSHQAVIDNGLAVSEVLGYQSSDRLLTILPMFSSFGFAFDFLHVLINRASVVIMPGFDARTSVELIEAQRVTVLAGVPTMFSRIFDPQNVASHDISSLRMIDVGGGPVSLRLKQMLKEDVGVTVIESYGLTEISPVAAAQRPTENVRTSSCGAPLPGFEVRVVDASGQDVGINQPGELLFRSNTFMLGYWRQPGQTRQVIRDGWLHSGDVGMVDDAGEIHILDRTKDVIVSNGYNVYPKEVENCIAEAEGVQAVAVVGLADEIRGETIHAFVVARQSCALDTDAVLAHCARHLSRYKVPRSVTILDQLPLTASGKVQRFRLREMLRSQPHG